MEREGRSGKEGDPVAFGTEMLDRLLHFQYLTIAGREAFDKRRRKNAADQHGDNYKITQNEMKARTGKNFGRGIDTMYRTSFRNHITLSKIADGKANMMISINTIILSIVITVSGASISFFEETFFENPEFLVPIISLLLSSLIAVVFAVFSARPSVTEYRIKKDKLIKSKEASLLYFGNFLKLEKNEFIDYMARMKLDQNSLYDDLARDLYDLGAVMHKKYLLLTISYNTFVGFVVGALLLFVPDVVAAGDNVAHADRGLDGNGKGIAAEVDRGFEIVRDIDFGEGRFGADDAIDAQRPAVYFSGFGVDLVRPANVDAGTVEDVEAPAQDVLVLFAE